MHREIDIGKEFSRFPAGRKIADGPKSGELFRTSLLEPSLLDNQVSELHLYLDNAMGYGSSFLEEAFGGLVRDNIPKPCIEKLRLFTDDLALKEEIEDYIRDALSLAGVK